MNLKTFKIKDFCEVSSSKRIYKADYREDGIPFYRGKDVTELALGNNLSDLVYIDEIKYNGLKEKFGAPQIGDILITAVGTLCNSYLVQDGPFYFKDGNIFWFKNFNTKIINNLYFYCILNTDFMRALLVKKGSVGAVQKTLVIDKVKEMEIQIPDVESQKEIANKILMFNKKISLNNQIISNLEEINQLLFRKWFIDFNYPDENGEMYRLNGGGLVVREGRIIPKDENWEVRSLPQVCRVVDCLHSKKPDKVQGGNESNIMLQLNNLVKNGCIDLNEKYYVSEEDYKVWTSRIEVQGGDCVITNAGRVGAVAQIPKSHKFAIGRNMTAIRPIDIPSTFLYYYLSGDAIKQEIRRNTDAGAFFKSLNVRGIMLLKLIIPPQEILKKFEAIVRPIREKVEMAHKENTLLTETRDLFIKKLLR
ncbi:type I restriction enzyme S subunit [Bacillus sp. RC240]|uniref:restriction endonuclease subunit S n=1 Tax=Bacillus sp. RC240 TaxID=3156285 RepID=UPI0038386186